MLSLEFFIHIILLAVVWPQSGMVAMETMCVFFEVQLTPMKQLTVKHIVSRAQPGGRGFQ
jgi:hypothetical protein